jgi:hypothetical protein
MIGSPDAKVLGYLIGGEKGGYMTRCTPLALGTFIAKVRLLSSSLPGSYSLISFDHSTPKFSG